MGLRPSTATTVTVTLPHLARRNARSDSSRATRPPVAGWRAGERGGIQATVEANTSPTGNVYRHGGPGRMFASGRLSETAELTAAKVRVPVEQHVPPGFAVGT